MSDEDLRDKLKREADHWLDMRRAHTALEREDRHARNAAIAELWAQAIFAVACIAAAVWFVQVVSR